MNFLLLRRDELDADGRATLRGRRADHLRAVLRVAVGQQVRAGVIDGPRATAVVTSVEAHEVGIVLALDDEPPPADDVLLLAVPRPKVLLRLYSMAAALGFGRIVLFRSWRVEKSHLRSRAFDAALQREHLLTGLEQTGRTHLPLVTFHALFKPMIEDVLPTLPLPPQRFVAHPIAAVRTAALAPLGPGAFALAIGPEGGFLPYEVDSFAAAGFLPLSCGPSPLRTETAVAVLSGQLALLRERGTVSR